MTNDLRQDGRAAMRRNRQDMAHSRPLPGNRDARHIGRQKPAVLSRSSGRSPCNRRPRCVTTFRPTNVSGFAEVNERMTVSFARSDHKTVFASGKNV